MSLNLWSCTYQKLRSCFERIMSELIFEKKTNDDTQKRHAVSFETDRTFDLSKILRKDYLREKPPLLPSLSELEVMRHFTGLSEKNFCIEKGFYPLGSCTMKYNPKVNEWAASLEGFTNIHPHQDDDDLQGALELMYKLQESLKILTGMEAMTLQPAAGAHGEFTGMSIVKKYFEKIGEKRTKVIVPDSSHGTNPATAHMCGFEIVQIKSDERGQVDVEDVKKNLSPDVAAIMMTNPNTLGIFEENILEISKLAHENGSLLYYDGANLNAVMGITTPHDMGFDIVHLNLHKTFAAPHGGGGPGSGPVGVVERLKGFLPVPVIEFDGTKYFRNYDLPDSIGKVKAFFGNFGVMIKAYTYILMMGMEGLKLASCDAVLNANYLKEKLKDVYKLPYDIPCMHEFVLSAENFKDAHITAMNIAKRLIDYGVHPPTVYFPLIVHEALMIEPTESESKAVLDNFVDIMHKIAEEVQIAPELLFEAPHNTPVLKVDEVQAARQLNVRYQKV